MEIKLWLSWKYVEVYDWFYPYYVKLWRKYDKFKKRNFSELTETIYDEFSVKPNKMSMNQAFAQNRVSLKGDPAIAPEIGCITCHNGAPEPKLSSD